MCIRDRLRDVGITTIEELKSVGSKEAWRRILTNDSSACIMRLSALEGAIQDVYKRQTQDYGLAAMCLSKRAVVFNQDGMEYTTENIDSLLSARHTAKKIRSSGGRLKGMKKRTQKQDVSFQNALQKILANAR